MQLHELRRKVERFLFRLRLDDSVAADNLLALDERSIDDLKLYDGYRFSSNLSLTIADASAWIKARGLAPSAASRRR